jgi:hypothetical protein
VRGAHLCSTLPSSFSAVSDFLTTAKEPKNVHDFSFQMSPWLTSLTQVFGLPKVGMPEQATAHHTNCLATALQASPSVMGLCNKFQALLSLCWAGG